MNDPFGRENDVLGPEPARPVLDPRGEDFIREHWDMFMGIATYSLRNPHDAEDAVMDAMVIMHRKIERILVHPKPLALALRILNHAIIDFLRRAARLSGNERPVAELPTTSYLMELGRYDRLDRAMEDLAAIAPLQAQCLQLYDLLGLSYAQIAQALGITETAAKTNASRARKRLETLMLTELPKEKGDS
ncbi:RNA polymerase sigma factor [Streptomyces erythrochromogenes]|uniref:RNA polymerase sigma factor n=1 Tax=Streptomyces erythrochromogenes TaxID=285574 RepID=UPI00056CE5B1|nr:sigma-70 family RNA polymerase sigma factor [Streptomyces erythrochromogenes]